jgi:hypothetical protein
MANGVLQNGKPVMSFKHQNATQQLKEIKVND